jgi:ATP-binding cassette, subfamily B, bacterial
MRAAPARRIGRHLDRHRGRLALTVACLTVEAALGVVPILVFKEIVDELTAADPGLSGLWPLLLAGTGAILAGVGLSVASTALVQSVGRAVEFELREQLFGHLVTQSAGFYTRSRGGELLARVLNDVSALGSVLTATVPQAVRSGLVALSTVAVMVVLDWRLALVTLAVLPPVAVLTRRAGHRLQSARTRVQEQVADVTAYLQETLGVSGALLVRAFGRQAAERERFTALNDELRRRELHLALTSRWLTAALGVLQTAGPLVLIVVGSVLVVQDATSVGTVVVFATVIAGRLGMAINGLATTAAAALGSLSLWRRIFEVLDTRPDLEEAPDARPLEDVRGAVELRGVTFAYPGQERAAVRDLDVVVEPGQLVALVGPSGAGKTTLGALVARLVDPQQGVVRIDGHDVREVTLASLSATIGLVFQDSYLFHTTLRENLLYGRPDAGEPELLDAVRDASLADLVARLPDGLDTRVGERGVHLSGGERQRVALARVLLKDPPILVLDEATSHLDPLLEREVQSALERLFAGRTSFVIAHRLSTVRAADVVLVLDEGRIVERGTHEGLVGAGGLYARLHAAGAATGGGAPSAPGPR